MSCLNGLININYYWSYTDLAFLSHAVLQHLYTGGKPNLRNKNPQSALVQ